MNHFLLWILIVLFLDRCQLSITGASYSSKFCTLGALDEINNKNIKAPMAYRVLVPWTIGILESWFPIKQYRITVYEWIKILAMLFAFLTIEYALGFNRALFIAACIPVTFLFDYTDCYFELAAYACALSGNFELSLISCMLLSLERETAPLVPVTFFLVTGNLIQSLELLTIVCTYMLAVRIHIGHRELYCERVMIGKNLVDLDSAFQFKNVPYLIHYPFMALLLLAATEHVILTVPNLPAWPIPLVIIILGYLFGIAKEVRIFMPLFLWLAIGLIK